VYTPLAFVIVLVTKRPEKSWTTMVTPDSGVPPVPVTAPEMRPPSTSAKLIFGVVAPAVTVIGVPVVTVQPDAHETPLYTWSMYPRLLNVRAKYVPAERPAAVYTPLAFVLMLVTKLPVAL
jgi:hypothetical protein